MKEIKRDVYLNKIINKKENGLIKIVTGIRRCGKSYLLDPMYKNYLLNNGVQEDHIIKLDLDERRNNKYLNPDVLDEYIRSLIKDKKTYYVILDEIQKVDDFESILNGFLHIPNLDVYVTGSNSKFLSSDIITEFRGRGDEIRILPLSFSEFYSAYNGNKEEAWNEYITYGGLPRILSYKTEEEKSEYLKKLFEQTYISDIVERNNVQRIEILDSLVNILASSIGSLTNPRKLFDTFISNGIKDVSINTITSYINYLKDSFLISKAERYDIRGKRILTGKYKYYLTDLGFTNILSDGKKEQLGAYLENIVYNELIARGYNVNIGNLENGEIDFIATRFEEKIYIQVAYILFDESVIKREFDAYKKIEDNYPKYVISMDKFDFSQNGIIHKNIIDWLLDK